MLNKRCTRNDLPRWHARPMCSSIWRYMSLPKLTRQEPTARTMQSYIAREQRPVPRSRNKMGYLGAHISLLLARPVRRIAGDELSRDKACTEWKTWDHWMRASIRAVRCHLRRSCSRPTVPWRVHASYLVYVYPCSKRNGTLTFVFPISEDQRNRCRICSSLWLVGGKSNSTRICFIISMRIM